MLSASTLATRTPNPTPPDELSMRLGPHCLITQLSQDHTVMEMPELFSLLNHTRAGPMLSISP